MKLLQESPVKFLESLSRPPEMVYVSEIAGTLGTVALAGTSEALLRLSFNYPLDKFAAQIRSEWDSDVKHDSAPFESIAVKIHNYLEGDSSPIRAVIQPVRQTPFTIEVHRYLTRIPFGETCSYGIIAHMMGKPDAARAVGGACGRNQSLIVIPCHRVVASHGLGGFGGGLAMKRLLLEHEQGYFSLNL